MGSDRKIPLQANPPRVHLLTQHEAEIIYSIYVRKYGTSQSLDRLNERGGFGDIEAIWLLVEEVDRLRKETDCG